MNLFIYIILLFMFVNQNIFIKPIASSDSVEVESKLKLVFMIHRHGDRTPIQVYPLDPWRPDHWTDGLGQLTKSGKHRMFLLGKYIRKRYQKFLGSSPREAHIRSSGADRCLESVALVMAGMYRPEDRWQWDEDLGKEWQPFPIQTEPRSCDGMLNSGSKCLAAELELKRIHSSPEVQQYTQQKKQILEYVSINSGLNVTDLNSAEEIFDTLFIERQNGLELPKWVDDNTYQSLSEISNMTFYFDFSTRLIQRLRTGLLLKDIIKHIEDILPDKNSSLSESSESSLKKIFIFSTHDTQIALLLNALNIFDRNAPPFGSTILLELYKTNNDHSIKIFYLNDTLSEEPIALRLPNCTDHQNQCLFTKFNQSISDLIPTDFKRECHDRDVLYESNIVMSYLFGALLMLSAITLVYIFYIMLRPKNREIVYQMLPIR